MTCEPGVQRERLAGRGLDPADADRRSAAQAERVERARSAATLVIDASGGLAATRSVVDAAFAAALDQPRGAPRG